MFVLFFSNVFVTLFSTDLSSPSTADDHSFLNDPVFLFPRNLHCRRSSRRSSMLICFSSGRRRLRSGAGLFVFVSFVLSRPFNPKLTFASRTRPRFALAAELRATYTSKRKQRMREHRYLSGGASNPPRRRPRKPRRRETTGAQPPQNLPPLADAARIRSPVSALLAGLSSAPPT